MKRKYWIKQGEFWNVFTLAYSRDSEEEELAIVNGFERITRKAAEFKARQERLDEKRDPCFSGYGSTAIYPIDYVVSPYCDCHRNFKIKGYIAEYIGKHK